MGLFLYDSEDLAEIAFNNLDASDFVPVDDDNSPMGQCHGASTLVTT